MCPVRIASESRFEKRPQSDESTAAITVHYTRERRECQLWLSHRRKATLLTQAVSITHLTQDDVVAISDPDRETYRCQGRNSLHDTDLWTTLRIGKEEQLLGSGVESGSFSFLPRGDIWRFLLCGSVEPGTQVRGVVPTEREDLKYEYCRFSRRPLNRPRAVEDPRERR